MHAHAGNPARTNARTHSNTPAHANARTHASTTQARIRMHAYARKHTRAQQPGLIQVFPGPRITRKPAIRSSP
eukprot:12708758-Alexandrium_andersonii.AAC.1